MELTVETLIEILQDETNPKDTVRFCVKGVEPQQDFANLVDVYWDGDLILEFR